MSNSATQTITISARGQVLGTTSFGTAADAAAYMRAVRSWALARNVSLCVLTQVRDEDFSLDEPRATRLAFAS